MSTKKTVTIGIPAYNEGNNIRYLIEDILSQISDQFQISKIIVSSDGSTDNTVSSIEALNLPIVTVFDNKDRQGQSARQNQIIKQCQSDILVLLNADILIKDKRFIEKLIAPIVSGDADLTSSSMLSVLPKTSFESIMNVAVKTKNMVYEGYNHGNNVYTCHGAARAFSKKLYSVFTFKNSIGEDAYSYFFAKTNGFKYAYAKDTCAYIRYADNLKDHTKQSLRFFDSIEKSKEEFGKHIVNKEYEIPYVYYFQPLIKSLVSNPFEIIAYIFIYIFLRVESLFKKENKNMWSVATSSKNVR